MFSQLSFMPPHEAAGEQSGATHGELSFPPSSMGFSGDAPCLRGHKRISLLINCSITGKWHM